MAIELVVPCAVAYSLYLLGIVPQQPGLSPPANAWVNPVAWIVLPALLTGLVINRGTFEDQLQRFTVASICVFVGVLVGSLASVNFYATAVVAAIWGVLSAFVALMRCNDGFLHLAVTVPVAIGITLPINTADNIFYPGQDPGSTVLYRMIYVLIGIIFSAAVSYIFLKIRADTAAQNALGRFYLQLGSNLDRVRTFVEDNDAAIARENVDRQALDGVAEEAAEAISSLSVTAGNREMQRLAYVYSEGERVGRVTTELSGLLRSVRTLGRTDVADALDPIVEALSKNLTMIGHVLKDPDSKATFIEWTMPDWDDARNVAEEDVLIRVRKLLVRVHHIMHSVRNQVSSLETTSSSDPAPEPLATSHLVGRGPSFIAAVKSNLTLKSQVMRHGIRLGAAFVFMVLAYSIANVPVPVFMALAIVATVQTDVATSVGSAFRLSICTIIGCAITIVVVAAFPNTWAVIFWLGVFAMLAFTFRDYVPVLLFACLTPIFILLFALNDLGDWHLAVIRLGDTIMGCVIGLAACLIFWPRETARQWRPAFAESLHALGAAAAAVLDAYTHPVGIERIVEKRPYIVAAQRAEAHLRSETKVLLSQPELFRGATSLANAAVTRVSESVFAISGMAGELEDNFQVPWNKWGEPLEARFDELADAVQIWTEPPPSSELLEHLAMQARVIPQSRDEVTVSASVDHATALLAIAAEQLGEIISEAVRTAPRPVPAET